MGEENIKKANVETKEVTPEETKSKPAKKRKKQKEVKVRFSISSQIIWLVVAIIVTVVVVVYQVTLKDEKKALLKQMFLRGSESAKSFADGSRSSITEVLLDMGVKSDNKKAYKRIDFFELEQKLNVSSMLEQEDVIYAYIINSFNQIIAHSDKNVKVLSEFKRPAGVLTYKKFYKPGGLVEPIVQEYKTDYKSPITGKEVINGEVVDISFPLKHLREMKSIKTYTGEVHMGISLEGIQNTIRDAKGKLLNVAVLSIFIGIAGAYLLAMLIAGPIKKLVNAMRKVAKGDLEQTVRIRRKDEIGLLGWNFNNMTEGLREKEKIKSTFNKFVSAEVAEAVLKEGADKIGGAYKEVTMFFSDIRSFTAMSEKMEAHEVIEMLNEYFSIMTDIIIDYKGVIDKYVGDEVMAVWGAPIQRDNDVELCVRSAIAQLEALDVLNEKRAERGEAAIRVGVGINTGMVISGNMGSDKRLDYTVIGDAVNLASRLCDNADKKGLHRLIIAASTYDKVKDIIVAKETEPIFVKGKEEPIRIYEVHGIKDEYKEFTLE